MALSKLKEWLYNKRSSFLMYRFDSALRTVHRRHIAFQVKYARYPLLAFQDSLFIYSSNALWFRLPSRIDALRGKNR